MAQELLVDEQGFTGQQPQALQLAALLDALRAIRFDRQDLFQLPNEAGKITVFSEKAGGISSRMPVSHMNRFSSSSSP